ncbi:MAG: 4Fe-4S cluster-binding domain-containing protein [Candidatus Lokiarchaeota archaeon]|nr:4Fe-4S cluster-binding domain-containing protein [Candidatus Lokiarchaeota archaeon]
MENKRIPTIKLEKGYQYLSDYNIIIPKEFEKLFNKYSYNVKKVTVKNIDPSIDFFKREVRKTKILALESTQDCNLRCKYCIYSNMYELTRNREQKSMSFEIAKKGISYIYNFIKNRYNNEFTVSFYGGEPLLNKD